MLIPVLAGPVASALGAPLARVLGMPGRIGRRNATRSPRRTAQTSAALMIGLTLVSLIAVLGTSLSASTKQQIDSAVRAGYVVTGKVPTSAPAVVKALPGVAAETLVYGGQVEYRGSVTHLGAVTLPGLADTVNLHVTAGRQASALAAGQLLIDATTARSDHLRVGSVVRLTFAETGPTTIRVGGIFAVNPTVGSFVVGAPYFLAHYHQPLAGALLVATAPGTQHFERLLTRVLYSDASLDVQSLGQYEASSQKSIQTLLDLVYVLLALAVVIALIGIVNTLILSVFERTQEIGLMRAVGMRQGQVKRMIRAEAIIIALFGAVVGIVLGTSFGAAMADALRNNSVTTVSVPVVSLIGFFILAGLLGLYAASWPARRAAKLDVLAAISTE
jgi:putative ABC transport system permease protein